MEGAPAGREPNGRFAAGNPGGPGRSRGRGYELLRAAQEAVTTEQIGVMMRKALRLALEGNITAMKFVMDRTCGRPPELPADPTPIDIQLPHLNSGASCAAAIDKLAAAATAGTIDPAGGKLLLDIVQARLKAIEVTELEARIIELERSASLVQTKNKR